MAKFKVLNDITSYNYPKPQSGVKYVIAPMPTTVKYIVPAGTIFIGDATYNGVKDRTALTTKYGRYEKELFFNTDVIPVGDDVAVTIDSKLIPKDISQIAPVNGGNNAPLPITTNAQTSTPTTISSMSTTTKVLIGVGILVALIAAVNHKAIIKYFKK